MLISHTLQLLRREQELHKIEDLEMSLEEVPFSAGFAAA